MNVSPSTSKDLAASKVAGVDVGGTFTDLVMYDAETRSVRLAKTPTTLENQAFGVLKALELADADLSTIDLIVHGTTTTTNAAWPPHTAQALRYEG